MTSNNANAQTLTREELVQKVALLSASVARRDQVRTMIGLLYFLTARVLDHS